MSFKEVLLKQAEKRHTCFCCEKFIYPSECYNTLNISVSKGVKTLKFCLCCTLLQSLKEGPNKDKIIPGEFTEKKIPSCLRKVRDEFYEDMPSCVKKYQKDPVEEPIKPIKRIIANGVNFNNRVMVLPKNKLYKFEKFIAGNEITISLGVSGPTRKAIIGKVVEFENRIEVTFLK